ncbi:MAG: NUDIX domain-containing protein [Lachnospiraceae bacterium]|jgi:isopentenyldiphosphate isomerase|nr:NUDIX domain-containing protein [Lachnospiraceae bacterium]
MEELIDVLDENGVLTGEILPRSEVHKKGLWHRSIVVAIVNENNQILLQQRSNNKDKNAGMWDISVAGHLSTGQDSLSAAAREINEEVSVMLGYKTEIKDFRYMYSFRKEQVIREDYIERQFYDLFILRAFGLDDRVLNFQESEVQAIKFTDLMEIEKMIERKGIVDRPEVYGVLIKYLFKF